MIHPPTPIPHFGHHPVLQLKEKPKLLRRKRELRRTSLVPTLDSIIEDPHEEEEIVEDYQWVSQYTSDNEETDSDESDDMMIH